MRSIQALLTLTALLLLTVPVHAQEGGSCTANPRWILATVLEVETILLNVKTGKLEKVHVLSRKIPEGRLQMFDRCSPNQILDMSVNRVSDTGAKSHIEVTTWKGQEMTGIANYFIKETLNDLCHAMRDCADATKSRS